MTSDALCDFELSIGLLSCVGRSTARFGHLGGEVRSGEWGGGRPCLIARCLHRTTALASCVVSHQAYSITIRCGGIENVTLPCSSGPLLPFRDRVEKREVRGNWETSRRRSSIYVQSRHPGMPSDPPTQRRLLSIAGSIPPLSPPLPSPTSRCYRCRIGRYRRKLNESPAAHQRNRHTV